MVVRKKMLIWCHWVVLGGVGGIMTEETMTRTEGEMMTGGEGEMMTETEGGEEEMLRKTEAGGAEMKTAEGGEETMTEESVEEMMTEESAEGTMTGEGIMATIEVDMAREMKEELDMKSVEGEIGMRVGVTEITEERKIGKVEAPRKGMAGVQVRGTIEETGGMQMIGGGREITTEKGKMAPVRSLREETGQLREAWTG